MISPSRAVVRLRCLLPLLVVVVLALPGAGASAIPVRTTTVAPSSWYDAILPDRRSGVVAAHDAELSRASLAVRFDTAHDMLSGTMAIDFVNATGASLSEIGFRLYPNAAYYGDGGATIAAATIGGVAVTPRYESEGTAFLLPLATPLPPLGHVAIDLTFTVVVPDDSTGTFGVFRHDQARDTWALADWHPILAGWDRELGWRLDPPTPAGDPTYADAALYDLSLTLPAAYSVIAGGVEETPLAVDGQHTVRVVTGPARDLTLVVTPALTATVAMAGETEVRVWTNPTLASPQVVADTLALAVAALDAYGDRYGSYPFADVDLVATSLVPSILGVTWSGLIMLNAAVLLEGGSFPITSPDTLAFMVFHEIGHLWFGIGIGANSNDHPYLAEGLTNAVSVDVAGEVVGNARAGTMLWVQVSGYYRDALARGGDGIVDTPVGGEDPVGPGRIALTYGKGALGFLAIRLAMGDDAWFAAMRAYASTWMFGQSEPSDLRATLVAFAPIEVDVDALWAQWFEGTGCTTGEIDLLHEAVAPLLGA